MMRHAMAEEERQDVELVHPNRDKAAVKATKAIVILLLLASVALMVIISIGGWNTMEGAKPVLIGYILVYLVMAVLTLRWNRGALPLAAALGIILLIFAAIAGPQWFSRDKTGFTNPPLNEDVLGLLTLLLVPVELLLIAFAMRGFTQDWHVEIERPRGEGRRRDDDAAYAPGD
jgi:presenilin-like A22 family membrane protease